MSLDELAMLDATAQAELVRRREVTPVELVQWSIDRIERLNPKLNAVVTSLFEVALEEARALANGKTHPHQDWTARNIPLAGAPFVGVPFLIKELTDVRGALTTWGSRFGARMGVHRGTGWPGVHGVPAQQDAEIVRRFRQAGFIIVGKSNTPEFGLLPTTEPKLFGPTRNPWDLARTPGGSSGGAAAAVAAGLVPIAHANDGGGSIRIPASCCGLFGLKPSRARTPTDVLGLLSEHVITRSVRDSAAALDWICGPTPGSAYTITPAARPFLTEIETPPPRLRIGVSFLTPTGEALHPECEAAVRDAAELCEQLGHDVVEISRVFDGHAATDAFMIIWAASLAAQIDSLIDASSVATGKSRKWDSTWGSSAESSAGSSAGPSGDSSRASATDWGTDSARFWSGDRDIVVDGLEPATGLLYARGKRVSGSDLLGAMSRLMRVRADVEAFFQRFDLWLTPTLAMPPPLLGSFELEGDDLDGLIQRNNAFSPFTPIANVTGAPAASLPLYWTRDSLPIGVQFMGPIGSEGILLRLATELERARPWNRQILNELS